MIRRDLLKLAGGLTVSAAWTHPLVAAVTGSAPAVVVYDGRYSDARLFAATARRRGAVALPSDRDVAGLWYGRLERGRAAGAVAGLTTYADMMLMEGLAREAGRRMTIRIAHGARGVSILHDVERGTPDMARVLADAERRWPLALWSVFAGRADPVRAAVSSEPAGRAADHPGLLLSWVVA